jgi:alcohol dehydrogenase class IV
VLLAHAVRFNEDAVPEEITRIAAALEGTDAAGSIDALRDAVGLPGHLFEVGVVEDDLAAVARLSQANANVARNPRPVSEGDALGILRAAW